MWSVSASYAWCERLARRTAGNFYHAFRLLPRQQRRSMCALYAFLRLADDLGDGPWSLETRRAALARWRSALSAALLGEFRHPVYPALNDAIHRHSIPVRHLEEVLTGVEMDLDVSRYATFADLYRYCYHVASAVGLACIHIWGYRGESAPVAAEAAGIALQLTNILRDLSEDAARGRIYLPLEELQRFGYSPEELQAAVYNASFRELMRYQVCRAVDFYTQAAPLLDCLPPPGRAVFLVMVRTYRALLDEIVRRQYDIFRDRVRVPGWRKTWFVLSALPVRCGLWRGSLPRFPPLSNP